MDELFPETKTDWKKVGKRVAIGTGIATGGLGAAVVAADDAFSRELHHGLGGLTGAISGHGLPPYKWHKDSGIGGAIFNRPKPAKLGMVGRFRKANGILKEAGVAKWGKRVSAIAKLRKL